jgi:hypothetical protein
MWCGMLPLLHTFQRKRKEEGKEGGDGVLGGLVGLYGVNDVLVGGGWMLDGGCWMLDGWCEGLGAMQGWEMLGAICLQAAVQVATRSSDPFGSFKSAMFYRIY